MNQIALPLDWPVADREEDFLLSDSNRVAFDHLRRWSLWPVMATLVTGPRKSGRSLLGRIFARKTGGRLFDDAERQDEEALFHAWNEAQERRRPLFIVADAPPPAWEIALPDLKSRLAATPHVEILPPDDALIAQLIVKLLGDRGIAVSNEIADYLVPRIERSHVAVLSAVDILDQAMLSHHRRMTVPLARRALEEARMVGRSRINV
ncbi:regulatory inactivation of DnaA Hda protein [Sphingosinicella ginsenosidimutans]|uniref:Chromosomal replication initiator DnaA n=1 Tax=Allosphingosinicella ginsenosidimutans TaxID=1176539 RepID=A0A5C6TVB5_9SPHN|nr:DnaA/Hda family protein [Sphingosinicella ginsenosidimutans]TXC64403.1 chromosomal replication initiator DnaA [Sphingosinicella ginsenosidimutans]